MENFVNNANNFLSSEQGKKAEQAFQDKTGFDIDQYLPKDSKNASKPTDNVKGDYQQDNTFVPKETQGLAGAPGVPAPRDSPAKKEQRNEYEGREDDDPTDHGGWGTNGQGGAFSRRNQMGADADAGADEADETAGLKTGYSTPGYRQEGADEEEERRRQNINTYGQQSDERGAEPNI